MSEDPDELLKGTTISEKIDEIRKLYAELERKEASFVTAFDIHCGSACKGECCHEFLPTITENEALYLAYGLILEGKAEDFVNNHDNRERKFCPFYKAEGLYHCTIYDYRPLLCRLFNASASKDKYGEPCFRKCRFNELGHDVSKQEFLSHKDKIIEMSDFGSHLEDEETDDEKDINIYEAVKEAINKIGLVLSLKDPDFQKK